MNSGKKDLKFLPGQYSIIVNSWYKLHDSNYNF